MKIYKPIILCFVSHYLPGFRSGGTNRAIANFVYHLGDKFDIKIVCYDRDINDSIAYSNVKVDTWNAVGKAKVFYASKKFINFFGIYKLLSKTEHDLLYLNSFFSFRFSIIPLLIRFLGFSKIKKPCVITPRGEFSEGAISFKKNKKKVYLLLANFFGLHKNLQWQASSKLESVDIQRNLNKVAKKIKIVPDLINFSSARKINISKRLDGPLRIVFLSRISPMKNLDYLLRVLTKTSANLEFSIFGVREDKKYWNKCQQLINKLPSNIKVKIGSYVHPKKVSEVFIQHDLFAFPTLGENFGHVIFESLSVGTPVLLSDQTMWKTDELFGLQELNLKETDWVKKIEEWANLPKDELVKYRAHALAYANKIKITNKISIINNKDLFYEVLAKN
jgi:glycosyltransferase involved in cell wall biosynthesis